MCHVYESSTCRWILTQVKDRRDETPADDELTALKHLLQPLLRLFTQFRHDLIQIYFQDSLWIGRAAVKDTEELP